MKKAVIYGGGNIGRGFIGALMAASGYELTFIDVAEPLVNALNARKSYPVRHVSLEGHEDITVHNVTAINGRDTLAAASAIAECDIMATAVGARALNFIAPVIASGLKRRWAANARALDIIICENLMDANSVLRNMIYECLAPEERARLDIMVGFVEASVGRMVPVQTETMADGDPLRVCVERYAYLPVDKAAFKGRIPEIHGLFPYAPFDFFIKRKLYIHNMGHAVCAYLGGYVGLEYIWQAIDDPEILLIARDAMTESAIALSRRYGAPLEDLMMHIEDLLNRFRNAALMDTCARVGSDPVRKLGASDRLIGASLLALEQGATPASIAVGAAGAIYRYLSETGVRQSVETAQNALKALSGLEKHNALTELILSIYNLCAENAPLSTLRRAAQARKAAALKAII